MEFEIISRNHCKNSWKAEQVGLEHWVNKSLLWLIDWFVSIDIICSANKEIKSIVDAASIVCNVNSLEWNWIHCRSVCVSQTIALFTNTSHRASCHLKLACVSVHNYKWNYLNATRAYVYYEFMWMANGTRFNGKMDASFRLIFNYRLFSIFRTLFFLVSFAVCCARCTVQLCMQCGVCVALHVQLWVCGCHNTG